MVEELVFIEVDFGGDLFGEVGEIGAGFSVGVEEELRFVEGGEADDFKDLFDVFLFDL